MRRLGLLLCGFCLQVIFLITDAKSLSTEQICGGDSVCSGNFRYMVSIQTYGNSICGGGILNDYFVITAAHCVCDLEGRFLDKPYRVIAGKFDLAKRKAGVKLHVDKVYVHKDFFPARTFEDIALLRLRDSLNVNLNPDLVALNLPEKNSYAKYLNKRALIAGYGWDLVEVKYVDKTQKLKEVGKTSSTGLKYAVAETIGNVVCREKNPNMIVTERMLCAQMIQRFAHMPEGVCSGDSGGPLVVDNNTIIGVLNTSPIGCDESKEAAVYARVSVYVDIINDVINGVENPEMKVYNVTASIINSVKSIWKASYPFKKLKQSESTDTTSPTNSLGRLYPISDYYKYHDNNPPLRSNNEIIIDNIHTLPYGNIDENVIKING